MTKNNMQSEERKEQKPKKYFEKNCSEWIQRFIYTTHIFWSK